MEPIGSPVFFYYLSANLDDNRRQRPQGFVAVHLLLVDFFDAGHVRRLTFLISWRRSVTTGAIRLGMSFDQLIQSRQKRLSQLGQILNPFL